MRKVFIDASVLLSASNSTSGAAYALISLCRKGKLSGYISNYVISEVQKNAKDMLDQTGKRRLNMLLLRSNFTVVKSNSDETDTKWDKIIKRKDVHILTCALDANVDFILTFDKKDFFTVLVRKAVEPIKIVQPKDLLR